MDGLSLQQRWEKLEKQIRDLQPEACVRVLAVSKKQPVDVLEQAYDCGLHSFGENYWSEFVEKKAQIVRPDLKWHFIGRVQSNKISKMAGEFELIHSLGDLEHLKKLEEVCVRKNVEQKFLLQINVSGESSKAGLSPKQGEQCLEVISQFKKARLQGLMTMPPLFDDPSRTEPYFIELKELGDQWNSLISGQYHQICELSMGTSNDFEYAVKAGATIVRIGSALLGPRGRG